MTRLESVDIRGLRGIVDLTLPFDGGSLVVGGANGTGKSACVDAIEFLYYGTIGTLTGTQGLSLREHGPHIHSGINEASVTATYDDPRGSITRRLSGGLDVPVSLEDHLAGASRLAFVLRRSQLQQFIHAKPADRYRNMADLIGADGLERTELGLKHARDTLEDELRQQEMRLGQIDEQLTGLPPERSDEDLRAEADAGLRDLDLAEISLASLDGIPALRATLLRSLSPARPDPAVEAKMRLAAELRRGIGQDQLLASVDAFRALLDGPGTAAGHVGVELLHLLRRGRDYLREAHIDACPLCERDIAGRALFSRLVERVAELEEVSLHEQRLQQARDELISSVQDTGARLRGLDRLQADAGVQTPSGPVFDALAMLQESVRSGALAESRDMAGRMLAAVTRWQEWSRQTVDSIESAVSPADDDGQTLPVQAALEILENVAAERARSERGRQESARLREERDARTAAIGHAQTAFQMADTAYRTFNRIKNEEVQRVFDELRADLARMYDFLHPGEGHGTVAIAMDPKKRGSSDLRMGFYDRGSEDPRAFASEGHLDSLGLCIFLAFVKRFNGDWPLLVLDDVVTSVDTVHKQRVAQLLYREFGNRQLFITTNDSRWFSDLRRAQQENGIACCHNLVIESWSLATGPKVRETVA